jgi:hypothetical protein
MKCPSCGFPAGVAHFCVIRIDSGRLIRAKSALEIDGLLFWTRDDLRLADLADASEAER